jgi:hypothetical protein
LKARFVTVSHNGITVLGASTEKDCYQQTKSVNKLFRTCAERVDGLEHVSLSCSTDGAVIHTDATACAAASKLFSTLLLEFDVNATSDAESDRLFLCQPTNVGDRFRMENQVSVVLDALNRAVQAHVDGHLFNCDRTTATTSETTSGSSTGTSTEVTTATTSGTSTATSKTLGRIQCLDYSGDTFLKVDERWSCETQAGQLNELLKLCTGTLGTMKCSTVGGANVLVSASQSACADMAEDLNVKVIQPLDGLISGKPGKLSCMIGGYLRDNSNCADDVEQINFAISELDGSFRTCQVTTVTSTG